MMRILVDTNILLRIAEPLHALHATFSDCTRLLREQDHELVIVPQTIYEFWAVATRNVERNGLGKSVPYTEALVEKLVGVFRLLRDERAIYETWFQLVTSYSVSGVNSYDARLAAAMQRHQLTHFLTLNAADFQRYRHITLLDPIAIVDEARQS